MNWLICLERATGIEPATEGWKPTVLPLNYTRIIGHDRRILTFLNGFAIRYIVTLSYRGLLYILTLIDSQACGSVYADNPFGYVCLVAGLGFEPTTGGV